MDYQHHLKNTEEAILGKPDETNVMKNALCIVSPEGVLLWKHSDWRQMGWDPCGVAGSAFGLNDLMICYGARSRLPVGMQSCD